MRHAALLPLAMKVGPSLLLFTSLAAAAPDAAASLPSLVKQAQAAEQQNRLDDAAALYKKILLLRPGWASAELNLGIVHHSRGDYPAAIRALSDALRHQSDLHSALLFRGASYSQTDRPEEAIRDLNEYLRYRPDDVEALPILASAYLARNDPAQAASAYAALARVTNDAAAWYRLRDCYARMAGQTLHRLSGEHANEFRKSLTPTAAGGCQSSGDSELTSLACAAERGDFETATRALASVLSKPVAAPDHAARLAQAIVRISQLAAGRVLSVAPDSGWAALLRAQAADEAGQTETADLEYRKAISASDAAAEMHVRYGQFQCKQGRLEEGLASYEKALRMDPSHTELMSLIGEVHVLQNRPKKAIGFLRKALNASPREQQVRLYLAQSLNRIGQTSEAVRILEAAPEDRDGRIHYVLARTLQKLGQEEKARKAMEVFRQRRDAVKP